MTQEELLRIPLGARERVQARIRDLQAAGEPLSVRAVLAGCGPCSRDHATTLVRAVKAGDLDPAEPWTLAPAGLDLEQLAPGVGRLLVEAAAEDGVPLGLSELVQGATTLEELQAAGRLCASNLAGRNLEPAIANALTGLLREQRLILAERREVEGDDRPGHCAVLTHEGLALARDFDEIVDGRERRRLRELVSEAADADHERFPREILADPERARELLAAAGLDAFGEPLTEATP